MPDGLLIVCRRSPLYAQYTKPLRSFKESRSGSSEFKSKQRVFCAQRRSCAKPDDNRGGSVGQLRMFDPPLGNAPVSGGLFIEDPACRWQLDGSKGRPLGCFKLSMGCVCASKGRVCSGLCGLRSCNPVAVFHVIAGGRVTDQSVPR